jgi:hypothetical protein
MKASVVSLRCPALISIQCNLHQVGNYHCTVSDMAHSLRMNIFIIVWLVAFTTAGMAAQGRDNFQILMQEGNDGTAHQAPLKLCNIEDKHPDEYLVYLTPGVSLEEHKERIGNGLLDAIHRVFDNLYLDKVLYNAQLGAELLDAVRADPGVELVECNIIKRPSKTK